MAGKVVSEKILSVRDYAGAVFYKKEQLIVVKTQETRHVQHLETGYTYNTLCDIYTYFKRVVEERSTVPRGTFLEHADCPRQFKRMVVHTPPGTKRSDKSRKLASQMSYAIRKATFTQYATDCVQKKLKNGKIAFVGDKIINPVKFDLSKTKLPTKTNK